MGQGREVEQPQESVSIYIVKSSGIENFPVSVRYDRRVELCRVEDDRKIKKVENDYIELWNNLMNSVQISIVDRVNNSEKYGHSYWIQRIILH